MGADGTVGASSSGSTSSGNSGAYGAIGLQAFAGGFKAFTQLQAGKANSAIDNWNAEIADLQSRDAISRGQEEQNKLRRGARRLIGAQRAGFAGQGVAVDSGSAAAVVEDTYTLSEADARTVANNAIREAWGFQVQATGSRFQAGQARRGGFMAAAGTLLDTGSDIYGFSQKAELGQGRKSSTAPSYVDI
jgi:hypothetical protein